MKLSFSLKNKEAMLEADVEKLVEKGMDQRAKNPNKKCVTKFAKKRKERIRNLNRSVF